MQKNVTGRTVVIVVTILVCVFGIIGFPKSGTELVENVKHRIRLGLDLKGGSHLVLQVHVQDAIKTEADGAIERMKEEMRKLSIDYTGIDRNDPNTVTPQKSRDKNENRRSRKLPLSQFPDRRATPDPRPQTSLRHRRNHPSRNAPCFPLSAVEAHTLPALTNGGSGVPFRSVLSLTSYF